MNVLKAIATDSVKVVWVLLVLVRGRKGVTESSKEIPNSLNMIFYSVNTITGSDQEISLSLLQENLIWI